MKQNKLVTKFDEETTRLMNEVSGALRDAIAKTKSTNEKVEAYLDKQTTK
jgi:hypothetical protein